MSKNPRSGGRHAESAEGGWADQFYGERTVNFQDPFGHVWHFSTVKETLTVDEMMKRMPK